MLTATLILFGLLVVLNVTASFVPAARKHIRTFDVFRLVGQWTFFSNSPESLFTDVEVILSDEQGEKIIRRLSEVKFPHCYPLFDPWRRYWKIVSDHVLRAKSEAVPGEHTEALHALVRRILGLPNDVHLTLRILPVGKSK